MKALTLLQPWATLVAIGAKKIETRSWPTKYRGLLAIHASKGKPQDIVFYWEEPWQSAFIKAGILTIEPSTLLGVNATSYKFHPENYHLGCVIAVCELVNCIKIPSEERAYSRIEKRAEDLPSFFPDLIWLPPAEPERSFGYYAPGRYAWIMTNVRALSEPVPARGRLGLWEWD